MTSLMKRVLLSIAASVLLCSSVSAQVFIQKPQKRGNSYANTIITVEEHGGQFAGFHGVFEVSPGIQVSGYSSISKALTIISAGGIYEFSGGLLLGANLGVGSYYRHSGTYTDGESAWDGDARLLATVGYMFGTGPGSMFVTFSPGVSLSALADEDDDFFSGDLRVGYRYMFKKHFGIAVSTGVSGTWDWWMSVPISVALVF